MEQRAFGPGPRPTVSGFHPWFRVGEEARLEAVVPRLVWLAPWLCLTAGCPQSAGFCPDLEAHGADVDLGRSETLHAVSDGIAVGEAGLVLDLIHGDPLATDVAVDLLAVDATPGDDHPSERVGVIVGEGGTVLTMHWDARDAPPTLARRDAGVTDDLLAVAVSPGANWIVAVGEGGAIVTSQDGGERWSNRRWTAGARLQGVDVTDDGLAWVSGETGLLMELDLERAGAEVVDAETPRHLHEVDVGWPVTAVGNGGTLLRGGREGWEPVLLPTGDHIRAHARDPAAENIVLGDASGGIWKTSDGGDTWEALRHPGGASVLGLSVSGRLLPGRDHLIRAVGADGFLWEGGLRRKCD